MPRRDDPFLNASRAGHLSRTRNDIDSIPLVFAIAIRLSSPASPS